MAESFLQLEKDLDRQAGELSAQVAAEIRRAISNGTLKPGDRLPASRRLAAELGVARGTVTTALDRLSAEGLLVTRRGAGTYVSAAAALGAIPAKPKAGHRPVAPRRVLVPDVDPRLDCRVDLRPCRPCLDHFPLKAWRRCLSQATTPLPTGDYGDPRGCPRLRGEIAFYLRRARGLAAAPEQIIITNGSVHAMHLLAMVLLEPGETVAMEDPGYPLAAQAFALAGGHLKFCPVDAEGIEVERLPSGNSRLVYVTPSHQFPTGSRLSLTRRHALIAWAEQHGAVIVEDDYDGEFRYDVPPLAPLAGLAPDRVVYCGTFSKTLFPDLRLGFAVAPVRLIEAMAALRTVMEYAPPAVSQGALRYFIAAGHFERHVQRMRRIYGAKRHHLAKVLTDLDVGARLSGLDSGLNAVVELESNTDAEALTQGALKHGIAVHALSRYGSPAALRRNALIVGYAAPDEPALTEALTRLLSG
ncbi:MAG: PLP-dependent aminotransferase family protein [Pseudomonadota bacterium]